MPSGESSPPSEGHTPPNNNTHNNDNQTPKGQPHPRPKKKRIRNFTADDRAAHRVFEKSRRDAFRERLAVLASLLPALSSQDSSRLSKHVVVDESIKLHRQYKSQQESAVSNIQDLARERDELLQEVNQWRSQAGLPPRQPVSKEESFIESITEIKPDPDLGERRSSYSQVQSSPEMTSSQLSNTTTTRNMSLQQQSPTALSNMLPVSFPEAMAQPATASSATTMFNEIIPTNNQIQSDISQYDPFNDMAMSSQASISPSLPDYMEGGIQDSEYLGLSSSEQMNESMGFFPAPINIQTHMAQPREYLFP